MGLRASINHFFAGLFFERPARGLSLAELADRLERDGRKLERSFAAAEGSDRHRIVLDHIIGIEGWGQNRLRVALGTPLTMDEYDPYRPDSGLGWSSLQDAFQATRQQSVALARELTNAADVAETEIPHNQYGNLTVKGWLQYLISHANLEAKRIG